MARPITFRLRFPPRTSSPTSAELAALGRKHLCGVGDYEAASGDDDLVILATFTVEPWWTEAHTTALLDDLKAMHHPLPTVHPVLGFRPGVSRRSQSPGKVR